MLVNIVKIVLTAVLTTIVTRSFSLPLKLLIYILDNSFKIFIVGLVQASIRRQIHQRQ